MIRALLILTCVILTAVGRVETVHLWDLNTIVDRERWEVSPGAHGPGCLEGSGQRQNRCQGHLWSP
jgi:hypothetical protein